MYKMFRNFLAIVTLLVLTGCGNWPHQKNSSDAKPLKVLVVGGGPAGLVSALEASHAGARVSVVEKRSNYSRQQHIILDEHSLNTLSRFEIDCPELSYFKPAKVGVVPINKLEEALKKKVESRGITILTATLTEINKNHSITVSDQNQLRSEIAYDILIGADGGKSKVRTELGIDMNRWMASKSRAVHQGTQTAPTVGKTEPFSSERQHDPRHEVHQALQGLHGCKGSQLFGRTGPDPRPARAEWRGQDHDPARLVRHHPAQFGNPPGRGA